MSLNDSTVIFGMKKKKRFNSNVILAKHYVLTKVTKQSFSIFKSRSPKYLPENVVLGRNFM